MFESRTSALESAGRFPFCSLNYFAANMDDWDPKITNGFAAERDVIIFDYPGIGRSTGATPSTVAAMTKDFVGFCRTLDLSSFDIVGFSLGGMIAQQLAFEFPDMVRRIILLGTGPRGGEGMTFTELSVDELDDPVSLLMDAFFTSSDASQAAGHAYLERLKLRATDRDEPGRRLLPSWNPSANGEQSPRRIALQCCDRFASQR
jgi:pimeloyl-ACP methyl ester carboxylesterase